MNKEANKTIAFLLILVIAFVAVDWAFDKLASFVFAKMPQSSGEIAKMNFQVEHSDYDCYVFGSSRAAHHYNPAILSDSLGLSTYNAGCDGQGISYADGLLNAIIDRRTPKMIILECGQIELANNWLEKMSTLKPYYKSHPSVLELSMLINGKSERLRSLSSFYRYNSKFFQVLKAYTIDPKDKLNGYEPIDNRVNNLFYDKDSKEVFKFERDVEVVLKDFVKTCKDNKIDLYVFCSPVLYNYSEVTDHLQTIFKELDVPFYDYSNDSNFINNSSLFGDFVHLNSLGADIYTKSVVKDLRNH